MGIVSKVSEHFICIPLSFPCQPWLYRKLSQWLINCPADQWGRPDTVSVCSGIGNILAVKTAVTQNNTLICTTWEHSTLNQNAVMISVVTRKFLLWQLFCHLPEQKRRLLRARVILTLPQISSRTLIRGVEPHLWMWNCTSVLITTKLLQGHDIIRRKSLLHPSVWPLIWKITSYGAFLPFTPHLAGRNVLL